MGNTVVRVKTIRGEAQLTWLARHNDKLITVLGIQQSIEVACHGFIQNAVEELLLREGLCVIRSIQRLQVIISIRIPSVHSSLII